MLVSSGFLFPEKVGRVEKYFVSIFVPAKHLHILQPHVRGSASFPAVLGRGALRWQVWSKSAELQLSMFNGEF
jgi:hypothetical protein